VVISVEEMRSRLERLDLGPIRYKLHHPQKGRGWSKKRIDRTEAMYRNWLFLVGTDPSFPAVPFADIDDMWHAHMLDSLKYFWDSEMLFGRYLHHFPYFGVRGEEDREELEAASAASIGRYEELFGALSSGEVQKCRACRECGVACREFQPSFCSEGSPKPNFEERPRF
jgi:hypothetical protein